MRLVELNIHTAVITYLIALGFCLYGYRQVKGRLREVQIPLLGIGTIFVFLIQLITFPVSGSLLGHFCGALLLSMILGPWTTCLVMALVILVQTVLFSQGSLIGMGANIINIGIISSVGGLYLLNIIKTFFPPHQNRGFLIATGLTAWISFVLSYLAADLMVFLDGKTLPQFSLLNAAGLFGLCEALITSSVIGLFLAARPDLVTSFCCGNDKDVCYDDTHHKPAPHKH
ncbi:MAG: energy-coupling factor ABC transporter permease [Candidatus Schekmanbacteria bacterium]|nr:energy-coupling factor ABC transporter permease [Candidatus Schekmanbacteria bacterium]